MVKVIENFLPLEYQNKVSEMLEDDYFPWYYTSSIYNKKLVVPKFDNITYSPGLYHTVKDSEKGTNSNDNVLDRVMPILNYFEKREDINIDEVLRIRIRRTLQYPGHNETKYNVPHVDLGGVANYKTLIYYPEDSDGDTILFDSKERFGSETHVEIIQSIKSEIGRFAPKKGKALYFKGDTIHAGNNPINYPVRTVINFDFLVKEQYAN